MKPRWPLFVDSTSTALTKQRESFTPLVRVSRIELLLSLPVRCHPSRPMQKLGVFNSLIVFGAWAFCLLSFVVGDALRTEDLVSSQ